MNVRILIDLTSLADHFSGIERYAACLTLEMLKNANNSYILIFKGKVHLLFQNWIEDERIEMVVLSECNKLLFNQIKLPFEIYKHKADCYLFMAFPVPILLFKKNMISTIHDICCWDCPETMNGYSKWYFRISHRIAMLKCKRIITISKYSEDRIVERLKYPSEKISLIYCGVDDRFRTYEVKIQRKDINQKYCLPEKYLLSLSTLEPRKNLRLLIEAYRKLVMESDCDVPLILAGRKGWKMDKLLEGIEAQVQRNILFTGFIEDDDLPIVYGNANLFIFPSMYEGFGIPPLEAMACGTPVISSDAASMPEVLGDAPVYFQSGNVEDLVDKIREMLTIDVETRVRMIERGIVQAKEFTWKKAAQQLNGVLRELLLFRQQ